MGPIKFIKKIYNEELAKQLTTESIGLFSFDEESCEDLTYQLANNVGAFALDFKLIRFMPSKQIIKSRLKFLKHELKRLSQELKTVEPNERPELEKTYLDLLGIIVNYNECLGILKIYPDLPNIFDFGYNNEIDKEIEEKYGEKASKLYIEQFDKKLLDYFVSNLKRIYTINLGEQINIITKTEIQEIKEKMLNDYSPLYDYMDFRLEPSNLFNSIKSVKKIYVNTRTIFNNETKTTQYDVLEIGYEDFMKILNNYFCNPQITIPSQIAEMRLIKQKTIKDGKDIKVTNEEQKQML